MYDPKLEMDRALQERVEYRRQLGENCPPPPPEQLQWRILNLEIAILAQQISLRD